MRNFTPNDAQCQRVQFLTSQLARGELKTNREIRKAKKEIKEVKKKLIVIYKQEKSNLVKSILRSIIKRLKWRGKG